MVYRFDKFYIGGRWVASRSAGRLTAVNPATEEITGTVPDATTADTEDAISAARQAFDHGEWASISPRRRADAMTAMGEIMRERRDELFALDIAETGRAQSTVPLFVDTPIDRWFDTAERVIPSFSFVEPMPPLVEHGKVGQGAVHREPYGVATLITPFNAPWLMALFKVGPALAAGCTVVLKPSPYTPLSAFVLAEIADAAGLPPGVLNVISGGIEASEMLTSHPDVDLVSFTGSDAVGRKILSQAAPTLKKVVLELGGKSANVICSDADLDRVTPDVLRSFTANCGQGCGMYTRTIVHSSLHDELVDRLLKLLPAITIGDPTDPSVGLGPLISAAQRERVEKMIAAGRAEGASVAYGGGRPAHLHRGYFLEPTLMTGVHSSMSVAQQEFFGPVGVVIPFDTDNEAIAIANDSAYGLSGSVWSRDTARAYAIARRIRTGSVAVNGGSGRLNPHGPFGGYKNSGLGREWGRWGVDEFLQHKTIHWPVAAG
ncbi:aldehyde dehydrogenase family protein [Dactylosporangium sp. NPDC005572]|uniref:aldehyde dehydrogenase family protein n=1 Tax=Dactylosporangium sp. NPDC005572 TaxID=3156889 RepID=UPI0033B3F64D